jgi:hypothetical protein
MKAAASAEPCHRCSGARAQTLETVSYVGPGPRVVELRDVRMLRCVTCGNLTIELPESRALDTLVRCLAHEMTGPLPQLAFEQGRWCILPRATA